MSQTVSDFIVQRLHQWGVRHIFGYPGDGINGVFGAMNRAQGKEGEIGFVQARHEEMAAFMASAYAKFSGQLGVCIATSGPGASHLITGLYDALLDHQPVLAIVGQQARNALGGHYQQEIDLLSMFKDVAGAYVMQASSPAQVRHLIDRAVRIALARRAPTVIILPNDLQEEPYESPPRAHGTLHSGIGYSAPSIMPREADLDRAAEVLNAGKKVAMLVGAGALGATDEVIAVADRLSAGCAKALLGKAALPDDLPWVTGSIGLLGTEPSYNMMMECDTLLMVGSAFPYAEFLPKEGAARGVQIDIDAGMMSIRFPMEVGLVGDAAETLRALLPRLKPKSDGAWRQSIEADVATWWKTLDGRAHQPAAPVNPQLVAWELSPRLPDRAIITSDSGSCANWFARDLKMRRGMTASLSGGLASMGAAVPYALAAKYAHPDRPVIALVGDGAMQMNNMAELITAAKYWRSWRDPRFVVCVFNNEDLNQVTWEQRIINGDPKFEASQRIPDVSYSRFAELIGLRGIFVDTPQLLGSAWEQALASEMPVVLEVKTDPEVPPLPPHITLQQAKNFSLALLKGDPNESGMIKGAARQVLETILPGKQ
ncbi:MULTISPECIES: thiamine pyrophosphate-requiring protein [Bradyrhizobium]|jgi:pyruvate dehydrogenase (quinone)|uniref:Pyruvate dehydrogenase (Quinone) n=1 Tax=Bradyrhizobium ottawaense TaxID=931866 RepID=A0A2U8PIX3_9BRAD|nr:MULTISPECIES: thiamine pyrophosphate-requiring protein [Bradyrhizobium]AWL97723.1 thiamine pyrophosphate-requiring protein [Bradyrhizobium ottawaense]MBR1291674.1 thiamine pyrophosphate-requiring protein [Bradyrhizobium ottawaense]MBR1328026.1 thiamine pyrophosphate-requiring protein [Bradyrhizobium ottawaense]MBR1337375.1 thiamine pyrophosphate-requiring protein [Bradyrhizobium ottawaense]MDA9445408.1 thiamine pyrophosphate-binding protein [Bradyrhizobium sp. CCBAU 21360]